MLHFYFLTEQEAKIKFDEGCSIHRMLKLLFCEQDCFLKTFFIVSHHLQTAPKPIIIMQLIQYTMLH